MKRSEMLEHLEEELKEFLVNYQTASDKARPHKIRSAADGILAMVEGFGMLPPPVALKGPYPIPEDEIEYRQVGWEREHEKK